jgi:hypothetical protein
MAVAYQSISLTEASQKLLHDRGMSKEPYGRKDSLIVQDELHQCSISELVPKRLPQNAPVPNPIYKWNRCSAIGAVLIQMFI